MIPNDDLPKQKVRFQVFPWGTWPVRGSGVAVDRMWDIFGWLLVSAMSYFKRIEWSGKQERAKSNGAGGMVEDSRTGCERDTGTKIVFRFDKAL